MLWDIGKAWVHRLYFVQRLGLLLRAHLRI